MKVLIADKVSEKAVEILKEQKIDADLKPGLSEDEIVKIIPEYDGMIVRSGVKVTPKIIEAASKLKVIGRAGVGVDNIDIDAASKKGSVVMNTPLGNVNAAAEHTLTLMMMLAKHIIHSHLELKGGVWDRKKYKGTESQSEKKQKRTEAEYQSRTTVITCRDSWPLWSRSEG